MAIMTVYHGGYTPVKNPEIRIGRNTKDFGHDFIAPSSKNRRRDGLNVMIQKLYPFMMFA